MKVILDRDCDENTHCSECGGTTNRMFYVYMTRVGFTLCHKCMSELVGKSKKCLKDAGIVFKE